MNFFSKTFALVLISLSVSSVNLRSEDTTYSYTHSTARHLSNLTGLSFAGVWYCGIHHLYPSLNEWHPRWLKFIESLVIWNVIEQLSFKMYKPLLDGNEAEYRFAIHSTPSFDFEKSIAWCNTAIEGLKEITASKDGFSNTQVKNNYITLLHSLNQAAMSLKEVASGEKEKRAINLTAKLNELLETIECSLNTLNENIDQDTPLKSDIAATTSN